MKRQRIQANLLPANAMPEALAKHREKEVREKAHAERDPGGDACARAKCEHARTLHAPECKGFLEPCPCKKFKPADPVVGKDGEELAT